MFKGLSAINVNDMFERVHDSKTRGHIFKLRKHSCNLDLRKYFFSERVLNRWNSLGDDVISSDSLNVFKNRLERTRRQKTGFFTDT